MATRTQGTAQLRADIYEFACLYSPDVRKKRKEWRDGYVRWHTFNYRAILYDEGRKQVDSRFLPGHEVIEGESIEFDRHLVEVNERLETTRANLEHVIRGGAVRTPARDRQSPLRNLVSASGSASRHSQTIHELYTPAPQAGRRLPKTSTFSGQPLVAEPRALSAHVGPTPYKLVNNTPRQIGLRRQPQRSPLVTPTAASLNEQLRISQPVPLRRCGLARAAPSRPVPAEQHFYLDLVNDDAATSMGAIKAAGRVLSVSTTTGRRNRLLSTRTSSTALHRSEILDLTESAPNQSLPEDPQQDAVEANERSVLNTGQTSPGSASRDLAETNLFDTASTSTAADAADGTVVVFERGADARHVLSPTLRSPSPVSIADEPFEQEQTPAAKLCPAVDAPLFWPDSQITEHPQSPISADGRKDSSSEADNNPRFVAELADSGESNAVVRDAKCHSQESDPNGSPAKEFDEDGFLAVHHIDRAQTRARSRPAMAAQNRLKHIHAVHDPAGESLPEPPSDEVRAPVLPLFQEIQPGPIVYSCSRSRSRRQAHREVLDGEQSTDESSDDGRDSRAPILDQDTSVHRLQPGGSVRCGLQRVRRHQRPNNGPTAAQTDATAIAPADRDFEVSTTDAHRPIKRLKLAISGRPQKRSLLVSRSASQGSMSYHKGTPSQEAPGEGPACAPSPQSTTPNVATEELDALFDDMEKGQHRVCPQFMDRAGLSRSSSMLSRRAAPIPAPSKSSRPTTVADHDLSDLSSGRLATQLNQRAPDFMSAHSFMQGSVLKLDVPLRSIGMSARELGNFDMGSQSLGI